VASVRAHNLKDSTAWPTNSTLGGLFFALQFFFAALTIGFFTLAFQNRDAA
jgi:hypothetical protein